MLRRGSQSRDWCRCLRCECEAESGHDTVSEQDTVFFMTVSHAWRYDVGHMLEGTDRIPEGPKLTRYSTLRSSDVCVFYVLFYIYLIALCVRQ